jgi:hypothetical protein
MLDFGWRIGNERAMGGREPRQGEAGTLNAKLDPGGKDVIEMDFTQRREVAKGRRECVSVGKRRATLAARNASRGVASGRDVAERRKSWLDKG